MRRATRKSDQGLAFALARENYCAYVVLAHHGRWIAGKLHRYLCDTVQEFVERRTDAPYEILILSVPPQHGKSLTVTETLPSWYLGRHPDKRVIEVSYNDDFAGRFGRRNRDKIVEFGGSVFGIMLDKAGEREFGIKGHAGGMISRGVMSGITGNPGDLIIIDDPIKSRLEADSQVYRDRLWAEWESSIRTRTQAGAKVILIQTRWHEDDLAGRMIANEPNTTVINIPCEAEADDLLGRATGQALCPEIGKGDEWLKQFKAAYQTESGTRAWTALFQGHPSAAEGNIVRREWWRKYRRAELPELDYLILSVDAAFKGGADNDFVAIQAWGKRHADLYLIDAVKRHLDFPSTLREIGFMYHKFKRVNAVFIEDKANGPAIIQMMGKEIPGVVPVDPEGGKAARVNAVAPAIESGHVFVPEDADFTGEFIDEWAAFPNGPHDDQVDAGSQAINKLLYYFKTVQPPQEEFPFHVQHVQTAEEIITGGKINVI